MTIYVTGSHGFIGSRLIARLPGAIPVPKTSRAVGAEGDTVYLLGAYGNRYGQEDVAEMIRVNVPAYTRARVVYLSTSSVLLEKQTPYSRTKRAAEEILLAQGNACVIRPFSVTGAEEQSFHLIPTLIRSCLLGEKVDFVPWPEHDYIDVSDVVDAILGLAPHDGVFDVGTGTGTTNQQVLDMVEEATGKKANVNIVDGLRPYDTKTWRSFGSRQWGWSPKKTLRQSIEEMVAAGIADTGNLPQEEAVPHRFVFDGGWHYRQDLRNQET